MRSHVRRTSFHGSLCARTGSVGAGPSAERPSSLGLPREGNRTGRSRREAMTGARLLRRGRRLVRSDAPSTQTPVRRRTQSAPPPGGQARSWTRIHSYARWTPAGAWARRDSLLLVASAAPCPRGASSFGGIGTVGAAATAQHTAGEGVRPGAGCANRCRWTCRLRVARSPSYLPAKSVRRRAPRCSEAPQGTLFLCSGHVRCRQVLNADLADFRVSRVRLARGSEARRAVVPVASANTVWSHWRRYRLGPTTAAQCP